MINNEEWVLHTEEGLRYDPGNDLADFHNIYLSNFSTFMQAINILLVDPTS